MAETTPNGAGEGDRTLLIRQIQKMPIPLTILERHQKLIQQHLAQGIRCAKPAGDQPARRPFRRKRRGPAAKHAAA